MNNENVAKTPATKRVLTVPFANIVLGVCAAVLTIGLAVSGSGLYVSNKFVATSADNGVLMSAMRHHMTADMMHDGLRGVVFSGLYAGVTSDADAIEATSADLLEYSSTFHEAIEAELALQLPADLKAEIEAISIPLDAYIGGAENMVNLVAAGQVAEAQASLAAFDASFKDLEDAMSAVSDSIEAETARIDSDAVANANMSKLVNWGGIAVIGALVLTLFVLSQRVVSRPLSEMTSSLRRLSEGDLVVAAPANLRITELSDLAQVLTVFREALHNREELSRSAEVAARQNSDRVEATTALNKKIAEVVAAATAGDFSRQIEADFTDAELNELAESVNSLVVTVDRGLNETGEVLAALAETDLSQRVTGTYEGAFDRLKSDTNAVAEKLTEIVGQLKETSRSLKVATGEILSGANDLSERTTKQAAAIEETSATMDQLATTVLDNAKAAEGASQNAVAVSSAAEEGGEVMGQATEAMQRITSSSAKISNIIGLIDDIAFQTNLLALNASVEAARAGEAGKGFAVVAVEVRRLAQSAAEASSEVKQLIEQSATEVGDGSKLVAIASEKLMNMLEAVKQNADLTRGIAAASREQASSIEEVNAAVRQMDEMTQHNAALVEETNAAIEQTEAQASELDRIVDVFKLTGGHPSVRSAQPVAPANPVAAGIRGLHNKVKAAAQTYLGGGAKASAVQGNAALDRDWEEF